MRRVISHLPGTFFIYIIMVIYSGNYLLAQHSVENPELDKKVEAFLKSKKNQWRDLNVPDTDGKLLYDIIIKNGYTKGLEIGTSTGHSAIWIAWAMSKTNGKLITIEISVRRYKEAIANFEEAGLSKYIDARLANAHDLVKKLEGPFDFVFSDADKDWYTNYFIDVAPKLEAGGSFTAHNVRPLGSGGMSATKAYLAYVMDLENFTTTVNNSGGGLAISVKNN
ncbi:MAG: methyltransferase [Eudoraea sp.]|nr:methyltransferase [Eudoraea sp.]